MRDQPSKTFIVELRRDRLMVIDREYRGVIVHMYSVRGDSPMADGRGLVWVEITPEVGEIVTDIVPAVTYRDHVTALVREVVPS